MGRLTLVFGFGTNTNMTKDENRRERDIIEAGLALLREQGLASLTQPRVAERAGVRQSHITYYFPTRIDLVEAVARAAIDVQSNSAKSLLRGLKNSKEGADRISEVVARHENTRLLAALNQAADQEPRVQAAFRELLQVFVDEIGDALERMNLQTDAARVDLIHALFVGLSIIDLATGRENGQRRAKAVLKLAFQFLEKERQ